MDWSLGCMRDQQPTKALVWDLPRGGKKQYNKINKVNKLAVRVVQCETGQVSVVFIEQKRDYNAWKSRLLMSYPIFWSLVIGKINLAKIDDCKFVGLILNPTRRRKRRSNWSFRLGIKTQRNIISKFAVWVMRKRLIAGAYAKRIGRRIRFAINRIGASRMRVK